MFDAFDLLRSCVRAIDSAVRFCRVDTAPVVPLTVASSEASTFLRRNCLCVSIGLALCGTRKMRRTPVRAPAEQPALPQMRGRPIRRGSAHKHLALHAGGYGACRDYGPAPYRGYCWFLSALASILAKLCLAITLSRSITSAEHSANLAAASTTLAPALPYLEPFFQHSDPSLAL